MFFVFRPNFPFGDCRSCHSTSLIFTLRIPLLEKCRENQSFHFFGSFCFSFSTGAKRSPFFFTRATVWSDRNFSKSAFFFFKQFSTSSQVTGVETVGSSFARKL